MASANKKRVRCRGLNVQPNKKMNKKNVQGRDRNSERQMEKRSKREERERTHAAIT